MARSPAGIPACQTPPDAAFDHAAPHADPGATAQALRERVKELQCLDRIAAHLNGDGPLDQVLTHTALLIPEGMQIPEQCGARVQYGERQYASGPEPGTAVRLEVPILRNGAPAGEIRVWCAHEPDSPAAPFLDEERRLLEQIAMLVGQYLRRRKTEEERERLLESFEASEAFKQQLLASLQEGVIGLDRQGCISFLNPAACELLGFTSPESAIGTSFWAHCPAFEEADTTPRSRDELAECLFAGSPPFAGQQTTLQTVSGRSFPARIYASPLCAEAAAAGGAVISFQDITEAEQTRRELEEANRVKSDFLAAASHDLRTPLTAIVGYLDLLVAAEDLPAAHREYAALSRRAADKLRVLVDMLLDLSRLEHGQLALTRRPFDLREVLEQQVELVTPSALNKGIELVIRADPPAGWHLVGDADRIGQILSNLIGNAVKFTPSGSVCVHLERSAEDWVTLHVLDSGPGIEEAEQDRIFEQFVQGRRVEQHHGGTGLGLKICLDLVRLMGGAIDVANRPEGGACFTVSLPLPRPASAAPESMTQQATRSPERGKAPSIAASPSYVLVAEDDPTNALLLQTLIEQKGITVTRVEDGESAWRQWLAQRPDLAVLDVQMPTLDGPALTRRIRAWEKDHDAPPTRIAMATAHATDAVRELCMSAGADHYLEKPIERRALDELLQSLSVPQPPRPHSADWSGQDPDG